MKNGRKAFEDLCRDSRFWQLFAGFTAIPRPTGDEDAAAAFVIRYLEMRERQYKKDDTGNVRSFIPATPGYEHVPVLTFQAHLDMVLLALQEYFDGIGEEEDEILITPEIEVVDGREVVIAKQTTLGADNACGVVTMLLLADPDIFLFDHGPIELLFTVGEEDGMDGAKGLAPDFITGRHIINLDAEQEKPGAHMIYASCAGSVNLDFTIDSPGMVEFRKNFVTRPMRLRIIGLPGGHSGLKINENRTNAIQALAWILRLFMEENLNADVLSIQGGEKRNSVPMVAEAVLVLSGKTEKEIEEARQKLLQTALTVQGFFEDRFTVELGVAEEIELEENNIIDPNTIDVLALLPSGVFTMTRGLPLVQTSINLSLVETTEYGNAHVRMMLRGSKDGEMDFLAERIKLLLQKFKIEVSLSDRNPGWPFKANSGLLKLAETVYCDLFDETAGTKGVHAGLECGYFARLWPDAEIISLGPEITGAHEPGEYVVIESVQDFIRALNEIITRFAKQHK